MEIKPFGKNDIRHIIAHKEKSGWSNASEKNYWYRRLKDLG